MRFLNLIKADFKFQRKYGIWFVYVVFTLFYILILRAVPKSAVNVLGKILIYTDPAAMGLFFMGAIILLEKSQRINCSIAVSPVKTSEYIFSKVISLMIAGAVIGLIIMLGGGVKLSAFSVLSVALSSVLFSLCGLFVATKTPSLNSFTIAVVPFEMFICIPAIMYLFGYCQNNLFILHPGVASIRLMVSGEQYPLLCIASVLVWSAFAYLACKKSVKKYFAKMAGGRI